MKKLFVICALFLSSAVFAGGTMEFTEANFEKLKSEDAIFLIDVHATWCPTCRKQGTVIKEYLKQNPESDLMVLKVDYDKQKEWVKYFKAPRQSTLIMYKGNVETARSIAETDETKLFKMFSGM